MSVDCDTHCDIDNFVVFTDGGVVEGCKSISSSRIVDNW